MTIKTASGHDGAPLPILYVVVRDADLDFIRSHLRAAVDLGLQAPSIKMARAALGRLEEMDRLSFMGGSINE